MYGYGATANKLTYIINCEYFITNPLNGNTQKQSA